MPVPSVLSHRPTRRRNLSISTSCTKMRALQVLDITWPHRSLSKPQGVPCDVAGVQGRASLGHCAVAGWVAGVAVTWMSWKWVFSMPSPSYDKNVLRTATNHAALHKIPRSRVGLAGEAGVGFPVSWHGNCANTDIPLFPTFQGPLPLRILPQCWSNWQFLEELVIVRRPCSNQPIAQCCGEG